MSIFGQPKIVSKSTIIASTAIINTYFRKIVRYGYKIVEKYQYPTHFQLCPVAPVQRPVLDGLRDMFYGDVLRSLQVGDGTGRLQDAVVGTGAESLLLHGALQQPLGLRGKLAIETNLLRPHLGVGKDSSMGSPGASGSLFLCGKALSLTLASGQHPLADLS